MLCCLSLSHMPIIIKKKLVQYKYVLSIAAVLVSYCHLQPCNKLKPNAIQMAWQGWHTAESLCKNENNSSKYQMKPVNFCSTDNAMIFTWNKSQWKYTWKFRMDQHFKELHGKICDSVCDGVKENFYTVIAL